MTPSRAPGVDSKQKLLRRVKPWVRDSVAWALSSSGVFARTRSVQRLTIVTYHRVLPERERERYPLPGLVVTPQELEQQLSMLSTQYECLPVDEAHKRLLRSSENRRPMLGVSFDDGAHDNFEFAAPVLARLGISASFYVVVGALLERRLLWHDRAGFALLALSGDAERVSALRGFDELALEARPDEFVTENVARLKRCSPARRAELVEALEDIAGSSPPKWAYPMTAAMLSELCKAGHEVSSHSMTHPLLSQSDDETLRHEIIESRETLRKITQAACDTFCYPDGDYDSRALWVLEEGGYERAVTTRWGFSRATTHRFELLRCDMDSRRLLDRNGRFSAARLEMRLSGLQPGL